MNKRICILNADIFKHMSNNSELDCHTSQWTRVTPESPKRREWFRTGTQSRSCYLEWSSIVISFGGSWWSYSKDCVNLWLLAQASRNCFRTLKPFRSRNLKPEIWQFFFKFPLKMIDQPFGVFHKFFSQRCVFPSTFCIKDLLWKWLEERNLMQLWFFKAPSL